MLIAHMSLARWFWVSLMVTLGLMAALGAIDPRLRSAAAPAGIVSFELCAYTSDCPTIVQGWGPAAQLLAAFSLGLDYLFMAAYPAAICLGLILVARRLPPGWRGPTLGMAWLPWGAGVADAVENYCLLRMLLAPSASTFAWPASVAATVKFVILGVALGWLLTMFMRSRRVGRTMGQGA